MLRQIFVKFSNKVVCRKFYCTTCGGLVSRLDKLLEIVSLIQIYSFLMETRSLGFTYRDFELMTDNFSRSGCGWLEENISTYTHFVRYCFNSFSTEHKDKLVQKWNIDSADWPDWLLDGISYYFIAEPRHQGIWVQNLICRAKTNESIRETLRIKYHYIF